MRSPSSVDLKTELVVETLGDRKVGNREIEPVDRMYAEFPGPPGRLDEAADFGHGACLR